MSQPNTSTAALAAAAAILFSIISVDVSAADEAKVKCEGVNACKGKTACATATNSCKGQNECAGKGFLEMSKTECDAAKEKMKHKHKSPT